MQAAETPPPACTLPSALLRQRLDMIRSVTGIGLLSHRRVGSALHLTYRPQVRAKLEQVVALEQACCAFLHFELVETSGVWQLTINAPEGVGPEAQWLFEQFLPTAERLPPGRACGCGPGSCD